MPLNASGFAALLRGGKLRIRSGLDAVDLPEKDPERLLRDEPRHIEAFIRAQHPLTAAAETRFIATLIAVYGHVGEGGPVTEYEDERVIVAPRGAAWGVLATPESWSDGYRETPEPAEGCPAAGARHARADRLPVDEHLRQARRPDPSGPARIRPPRLPMADASPPIRRRPRGAAEVPRRRSATGAP